LALKTSLINALFKELELRQGYLEGEKIETIYIGGGTPSVLEVCEIRAILEKITGLFTVDKDAEITMEANPDDLTPQYLSDLTQTQVNRLSIGVQSFSDENLVFLRRRHNAAQAIGCVENASNSGFENISIDLIYGLPGSSGKAWEEDLQKAFRLPIKHLSAYHLTYHTNTHLGRLLKKGAISEVSEDESYSRFLKLIEITRNNNFGHYEISNFAKEGNLSKHNCGYWFGKKYLGIGPSAHSFNVLSRSWNISELAVYIDGINSRKVVSNTEVLSEKDKFNDYIITRLRTMWGISEDYINKTFGATYIPMLEKNIQKYLSGGYIEGGNGVFILTAKGLFISDKIMEDFIVPND
jgi:putative oxygen-independent coproporphyrinogen III oxidase